MNVKKAHKTEVYTTRVWFQRIDPALTKCNVGSERGNLPWKILLSTSRLLVALGLESLCRNNWYMVRSANYISVVQCGMFVWLIESRDSETFLWKASIVPLASRDVEEEQVEQTEFDYNPFYSVSWSTAARTVSKWPLLAFFFSFWGQIHLYFKSLAVNIVHDISPLYGDFFCCFAVMMPLGSACRKWRRYERNSMNLNWIRYSAKD